MRFHWQNLNEKKYGKGNPLRNGRAWFYLGESCLSVEWDWRFRGLMFEVGIDEHYERLGPGFSARLLWPALFVGLTVPWLSRWLKRSRLFGFSLHLSRGEPWTLRLLANVDHFHESGWRKCIFLGDMLRGRMKCTRRTLDTFPVTIPLPEGCYEGMAKIEEAIWSYSRWPWKTRRVSAWVDMKHGLPYPGKGENSWDCGEDAVTAYGCESTKYEDIVAKGVQSCMRNRVRYGSSDWKPTTKE